MNRRYAHNIVILEIAFVILLATRPNRFIFTAIITTYLVAIMMKIAKKGGGYDLDTILAFIAWLIEKVAMSGAGFFSWGFGYQPEVPEELLK